MELWVPLMPDLNISHSYKYERIELCSIPSESQVTDLFRQVWWENLRTELSMWHISNTKADWWWFSKCFHFSVKNGISLPGTSWFWIIGLSWGKLGPCLTGSFNWRSCEPGETIHGPRRWSGRPKPWKMTLGKRTGTLLQPRKSSWCADDLGHLPSEEAGNQLQKHCPLQSAMTQWSVLLFYPS